MGFCFAAVSRGCLFAQRKLCSAWDTQVKISIIALIAANFSLKGPCCHVSQQAVGQEHLMVLQMEMKESKGKKKKNPVSIQPSGRACKFKEKRRAEETLQKLM